MIDYVRGACLQHQANFILQDHMIFLHSLMGKANFGKKKRVDQWDMVTSQLFIKVEVKLPQPHGGNHKIVKCACFLVVHKLWSILKGFIVFYFHG